MGYTNANLEYVVPFFDSLQLKTAGPRAELFAVPVIGDCLAGRVTRAQYVGFLGEAYHHVKHTVPLLMACGSRLSPSQAWLRDAVAEYIDEERGHEQWILDDIDQAGGGAAGRSRNRPGRRVRRVTARVVRRAGPPIG